MRTVRGILIVLGATALLFGIVEAWRTVPPHRLVGLAVWLVLALIIHDGVIAMAVAAVLLVIRRYAARIPMGVLIVIQAALVTGLLLSFIAVQAIAAKSSGPRNPTVLPLRYGTNLAWVWVGIAVITAISCGLILGLGRLRRHTVRGS